MKFVSLFILIVLFYKSTDSIGQLKPSSIKRKTHMVATHRNKRPFGDKQYSAIGLSLNALSYYGDLAPRPGLFSTDIKFTRPGIGINYTKRNGPKFLLKFEFLYGVIHGDDSKSAKNSNPGSHYRYLRNLSFRNQIKELSAVAVVDIFGHHGYHHHRHEWVPYLYGGVAVFHHNPQAKAPQFDLNGNKLSNGGEWIDLRPLGTEGQYSELLKSDQNYGIKPYSLIQLSIPFGLGMRWRWNEVVDIWLDVGFRYLFTDYLDDVSQNYVDLGVLKNDLARTMSYRTNAVIDGADLHSYTGRDGKQYDVKPGYGSEYKTNLRGNKNDIDILMITSLRVTHILKSFKKAKSR